MHPDEWLERRQKLVNPPQPTGPGGLIPTGGIPFEEFDFPQEAPGEESVQPDAFGAEGAEPVDDKDRMMLRGRVLDTYGRPMKGAVVVASQEEFGQASCTVNNGGEYHLLLGRMARTKKAEEQKKEQSEDEGRLIAPPPPAPEPGRTSNIAVCVYVNGAPALSTRLYFQDVPENNNDAYYNGTRVIGELGTDLASFNLVLPC